MRLTEFLIVVVAALMFLIPSMKSEDVTFEREAQEESPMEEALADDNTYKIIYEVSTPREEGVADIIWMKKAAEVAQNAGVPYFNVLEQKIKKRYDEEFKRDLSIVEGVIELDYDPMRAEFDAQEIESLVLPE